MVHFERIYKLHRILSIRRTPIPRAELLGKLDCSRATLTRLIRFCRDSLGSPIEVAADGQGYFYPKDGPVYELPGLWLSPAEIHALLTSHRLLDEVKPGLLKPYVAPLKDKLEALLKDRHAGSKEIFQRIRILPTAPREARLEDFQNITDALVKRKKLRIQYRSRGKDELTERWISPQRLVYYRDNWLLDAWCHTKRAVRTFSIDRMNVAEAKDTAKDVPDTKLDAHFTKTYGVFAGPAAGTAVIRFSSTAARWVADEQWHPAQRSRALPDGGWELTVPYGDPTELAMDILKYGPDAEVISPQSLRRLVAERLVRALRKYRKIEGRGRMGKGNEGKN